MLKYFFALAGGAACAVIGMALLDNPQVGIGLGGSIGAGYGLIYGMLRDGA